MAYVDYFRSNFVGEATCLVYLGGSLYCRIDFLADRADEVPLPFPLTLSFKRKRIKDKNKILNKYGYY